MPNIAIPSIIVDGKPIPGPFGLCDGPSSWIKGHWDTHEDDEGNVVPGPDLRDPWEYWPFERWPWLYWEGPETVGALPMILFEESWGDPTAHNVWFRAEDGLSGEQKEAIRALPIPKDQGEWKGKPVTEEIYLEPAWNDDKDVVVFGVSEIVLQEVVAGLVDILSWPRDVDIDYAPISDVWALAIYSGRHPTRPSQYKGHTDRSALVAACAVAMDQAGMAEWEIRSVLLNPKYKISAHCFENGRDRAVDNVMEFVRSVRHDQA